MNPAYDEIEERFEPALGRSMLLALLVHIVLFAALLIGVRWQSRPPEAVVVELWDSPPPAPRVVEPPKPLPKVEPPPPSPEPKPEPRIEKPDIPLKAQPRPKPEPPKPVARPDPPKPKPRVDPFQKELREQLAREQATIAAQRREQEMRDLLSREAASARSKALDEYVDSIRRKVKSNWILPQDLKGNPEAIFSVVQLPDGTVLPEKLQLVKSSGIPAYDKAVERAILKSSPLPLPKTRELFQRELKLTFRPID
jgi:colicin import membrane protein